MRKIYFFSVLLLCISIDNQAFGNTLPRKEEAVSGADTLVWEGEPMTLQEAISRASFAKMKNSPLRLSTITNESLKDRSWSRTYPELISGIPGLYATSESGSYGDAKLNIRGFSQENISVSLNGIPISGLTSGGMYWNNWMGLAGATEAIQVQKGAGSSMLTDCSVGGSVNIVTTTAGEKMSVEAGTDVSDFGTGKVHLQYSSGQLPHGWSILAMGSYVGGRGYVDCTDINSFAFMLNVNKTIGRFNTLIFNFLGSPEKHGQRSTRLSAEEVEKYGTRYSRDWGWRDGERFGLNYNNYFKPYFTLQHLLNKGRLSMRSSLYVSIGDGGGRWRETTGKSLYSYTCEDGTIDWNTAVADNVLEETPGHGKRARNILSDYQAGHTQAGLIISGDIALRGGWKIGAGIHYQHYRTWEREFITDLLGADYWFEDYERNSLAGLAGRSPYKQAGDAIRTCNGKIINHGTVYLSTSWQSRKISAELGAAVFGSTNRRWDKYNYAGGDIYSDVAAGAGASLKAGLLWKLTGAHNLYVNGGCYSRMPYSSTFFASGNNSVSKGINNEKNFLAEAGYRFLFGRGGLEVTGYFTWWKDRTLMSGKYRQQNEEDSRYMVNGLDALHCGIEAEGWWDITSFLKINAFASVANWRWKNDVEAIIYDEYSGLEAGRVNVYCDGLPVGGAPQDQAGASLEARLPAGFRLTADWKYNGRMYAEFDPATRTDPTDRNAPFRMPSYHLLGAGMHWQGKLFRKTGTEIFVRCSNILNSNYIERGKDGVAHDISTFTGYWGFGRNFNFGLRLTFREN